MDEVSQAQLRIYHKVAALAGKEGNALSQILFSGDEMHYLGIDIGKNNHVASLIGENGKPVCKGFSFSNTTEGGESLLAMLEKHGIAAEDLEIGLEATGHYWLSVYSFLHDRGHKRHVNLAAKNSAMKRLRNFSAPHPIPSA